MVQLARAPGSCHLSLLPRSLPSWKCRVQRCIPVEINRPQMSRATQQPVSAQSISAPQSVEGLRALSPESGQYKAWLLDQFGVLHDGKTAYPGAVDAVRELHEAGGQLFILSNSSRRVGTTLKKLEPMGFDPSWFAGAITSGEITHRMLSTRPTPFFQSLGRKCVHFTWGSRGAISLEGLDLEVVEDVADADFLLAHGTEAVGRGDEIPPLPASLDEMKLILQAAAARKLPMIVANPDIVTVSGESLVTMPGTLARWYTEMEGGGVHLMGKPAAVVYEIAMEMMNAPSCDSIIAVGDSLEHDIAGASAADVRTLFVVNGIHKSDLPACSADTFVEELHSLCGRMGVSVPTYYLPSFRW